MTAGSERHKIYRKKDGNSMKILIVDDEAPAVMGVCSMINWKRLSIDPPLTAYSMEGAMKILKDQPVDLLISDIEMPGGSGFDLIQWNNSLPLPALCIILSSYPNFHFAQKAITLGVFEYLLKPVEESQLEQTLRRAVSARSHRKSSEAEAAPQDPLIDRLKQYVYDHISGEITRGELADHVGLSPSYLSTFFSRETGSTISDFIRQERVHFAMRLLRQTNLPVSVIGQNVGYDSLSYFSSVFRAIAGCTPREYRRACNIYDSV